MKVDILFLSLVVGWVLFDGKWYVEEERGREECWRLEIVELGVVRCKEWRVQSI